MELAFQLWKPKSPPSGSGESGHRLVLLHGMGGTGALWRPIGASLEDQHSLLALDQRGHGKSQNPPNHSYQPLDFGQDVIDTLASLHFHPAWLIGHSMGVRTACAAAHLRPDWVQGLILIDLGFTGPAGGGLGENLRQFLHVLPLHFASRAEARAFMNQNCPDPSMGQYLMAVSVVAADGSVTFPFDKPALIATLEAVRDSSVKEWVRELGQRGMPILALRGGLSGVWSREDFERSREEFRDLPSVRFEEIPGTGHGLPFEKRREFVDRVLAFIDEMGKSGSGNGSGT